MIAKNEPHRRVYKENAPPDAEKRALRKSGTVIAIGDVHGEFAGLSRILHHAGLVNSRGRWTGGSTTLVQIGDVVDRGPHCAECNDFLARLQAAAPRYGGRVIRFLGNHELELLKKNFSLTTLAPGAAESCRKRLLADIAAGKVTAAYSAQNYLFTHAGIMPELAAELDKALGTLPPGPETYAALLNQLLKTAALRDDFSHPVFQIGKSRGGRHKVGGVFWEDFRNLLEAHPIPGLRQIVGHTPLHEITVSENGKLVGIDTGLFRGYGGTPSYLKLKHGRVQPYYLPG